MSYIELLRGHRGLLSFGLLTAFASSFGQTFFISLFLPGFMTAFGLNTATVGLLYSVATLGSALLLPALGGRIDTASLRKYTVWVVVMLAAAALSVAFAPHYLLLGLGLLGLRLLGQGLLGHISQTVMAREFGAARGKALGVAGLGYPLGEALLPIGFAVLMRFVEWRTAWILVAVFLVGVVLPVTLRLLRNSAPAAAVKSKEKGSGFKFMLRDARLVFLMPAILVAPFAITGLFLYQTVIAQSKGWAPEWIAAAFVVFAIARAGSSVVVGPWIDRLTALRLLPAYALPLGLGALLLAVVERPWIAFPYLSLVGVTAGFHGSVVAAVWAELYGPENVGRARSMASSLAVFSTAACPALMGWMFQRQVSLDAMLFGGAAVVAVTSALAMMPQFAAYGTAARGMPVSSQARTAERP
jgi:MFS family permease